MYIAFLRLFKGFGDLNDLRVLNVLRVLRAPRVLNFLKAPGFLYKKMAKHARRKCGPERHHSNRREWLEGSAADGMRMR